MLLLFGERMKIETAKIGDLIPYEFNNRVHGEEQVDRIANSIKEFGFNQPIVVDESNIILVGHGRLAAAKKLKLKDVPILRKAGLSETQKKAYRILDNKLQNDSTWDFNNLELELGFLEDNGLDLESWGLDDLRDLFPEPEVEVTEDDFEPDLDAETYIKAGDLLELGKHRLLCGDSTLAEDVEKLANGKLVDMVLTDPPYGVSYVGKTSSALTIENDSLDEAELSSLVLKAFDLADKICRGGGYWYATVPARPLHILFAEDWKKRGILRQIMVWVKDSLVLGHSEYHYQHEPILFGWKEGKRHKNPDRSRTTVWSYDRPKANREHPTMKPIPLWAQAIKDGSIQGEVVYDCFLGSGTTLIAAEQLDRICYGMELSPKYCQVIVDRHKAHCQKVGKPFECKINGEPFKPINKDHEQKQGQAAL